MQGRRGQSSRQPPSRLPAIAPRGEGRAPSSQGAASISNEIVTDLPRTRLPPRSRTGCWTCRTRKVKCDEARPKCSQCARLGHECDYSPRLSFRDDTPRVVERNQEVSTVGSSVWDPASARATETITAQLAGEDTFPPFASLTNDEDREKKAELRAPGTYHIVVNPSSFADFEEYSDGDEEDNSTTRSSGKGLLRGVGTVESPGMQIISADGNQDPDIVILRKFEDSQRRLPPWPTHTQSSTSRVGPVPIFLSSSPSTSASVSQRHDNARKASVPDAASSLLDTAIQRPQDDRLLSHYRDFVRKKTFDRWSETTLIDRDDGPSQDFFEPLFESYPPLFHAMMALSALSLADREGVQNLDALNHYQRTLPSLQQMMHSEDDLFSNGLMLTHFILLIYEIAAAQPWGTTLWSEHLEHLLRIVIKRREVNGTEPYVKVMWYICMIDVLVVLCGCGTGEFVEAMLQRGLFPIDTRLVGSAASVMVHDGETEYTSLVVGFNGEMTVIAANLGLTARRLRQEIEQQPYVDATSFARMQMGSSHRQQQVSGIQQNLRWKWNQMPLALTVGAREKSLPVKVRRLYDHAYFLYHACIIYSHTSMYASQRIDMGPGNEAEISHSARQILQLAHETITSGHLEQRFLVFPLFMAGFASTGSDDKMLAVELIRQMDQDSVSRNTRATRELLEVVYERQNASFTRLGHSLDVDWIQVMLERGLKVVAIGL